ncbi:ATP-binding protein [Paraburkholderia sp. UCT2]|uniref:ATP-binding protein n=1 Tax=Paraburkholderia sp. UCT2 TaxID=2615208 RepID=UPI001655D04B|nr:ATP-binding protein [Paraburkholderia sp. UCT2]MBC8730277.1 ATP-binding protein [Paraburkholderia sp. UCT2]
MNARAPSWPEANQAALAAELARVLRMLVAARAKQGGDGGSGQAIEADAPPTPSDDASALAALTARLGLSAFERDLLVLCAGVELDSAFMPALAAVFDEPGRAQPTFSLALAILPGSHWSACTRDRPLRYWHLVDVEPGATLLTSPLCIDERIVHYLAGLDPLDARLDGIVRRCEPAFAELSDVPAFLQPAVVTAARALQGAAPCVALLGRSARGRNEAAAIACALAGRERFSLRVTDIPTGVAERELITRLWNREGRLTGAVLTIQCGDFDEPTDSLRQLASFVERIDVPMLLELPEDALPASFDAIRIDVPELPPAERRAFIEARLGPLAERMNGRVSVSAEQFRLDLAGIETVTMLTCDLNDASPDAPLDHAFWHFCRQQARHSMEQLARRIEPKDECLHLVLPAQQASVLDQIAAHVRQRSTVHETWGFAGYCSRGLGTTALFSGLPGTGKTMAAEALAAMLELDLYQIDLATVASKYIGETAKNLRRIFDSASESGAILLFDEADALFGQRTEVKDSHDRYANFDVSYLLQRMESYRGLAILTTNMKHAIDNAFRRRIRFVIDFPFPDAESRERIWASAYPAATPTQDLDLGKLGRLNVAGGIIHNIAMHAAYLAADEDVPVQMKHILRAAHVEYAKLERPLTASETQGWL